MFEITDLWLICKAASNQMTHDGKTPYLKIKQLPDSRRKPEAAKT